MNEMCAAVGFSEAQIETLANDVVDYFLKAQARQRHGSSSGTGCDS